MPGPARSNDLDLQAAERPGPAEYSTLDLAAWVDALRALPAAPVTERDIVTWIDNALRRYLPFRGFLGGYGKWSGGRIHALSYLSIGLPAEYLAGRPRIFDLNTRPSVAWWVFHQRPFLLDKTGAVDEEGAPVPTNDLDVESFSRFPLGLSVVHGVIDPFGKCGTYICFQGIPRAQSKAFLAAIKLVAPVLHTLFLQTKRTMLADLTVLTDRQRELLDLALVGLSDKAIACRLRISDNTVGNHFRAIYAKLGVTKRSQLIALLK